jgi:hypothetical protein
MGTGVCGTMALRDVLHHPQLELVGLYVTTPQKVGKDAGELCGSARTGIRASNDFAAMLALQADCLCYASAGSGRELEAARDIARFLERGTNAVTHSIISVTYPPAAPPEIRSVLESACQRGGTSFYNTGVEPGVMSGQMLISALSFAGDVSKVVVTEFGDPRKYGVESVARFNMGFGMPADFVPPRFRDGRVLTWWRPMVDYMASLLQVRIDDYRFVWDTATTASDIETAFGLVKAGTLGGTLWEVQGIIAGRPALILRHASRLQPCTKEGWPPLPPGARHNAYQIHVEGSLNYDVNVLADHDEQEGIDVAVAATASHTVNAIPVVCAAQPGLLDQTTVGSYCSRNVQRMLQPE